jgi:hypothetical protein
MLGPIDYIVVGFEGNNFDGSILAELQKAAEAEIIRVVDLLFIIKDEEGSVLMAELEDQHDELKEVASSIGHTGDLPLLSEEDVEKLGSSMKNNSSAGVLVIEQLWAKGLKQALINAGAELIDEGRIHPDKVAAAIEDIESAE